MVDAAHSAVIFTPMTLTQSRTSWTLELGSFCISMTRMREARTVGCLEDAIGKRRFPKLVWPIAVGTFASVSALGLAVIGASASELSSYPNSPHRTVSVPVPTAEKKRPLRLPERKPRSSRPASAESEKSSRSGEIPPGARFDAEDEVHVARAMLVGELQEWLGADGKQHFLNAGPAQLEAGRLCRDLVLLVRRTDGGSHTRSIRRCTTGHFPDQRVVVQPAAKAALAHDRQGDVSAGTLVPERAASSAYAPANDPDLNPLIR